MAERGKVCRSQRRRICTKRVRLGTGQLRVGVEGTGRQAAFVLAGGESYVDGVYDGVEDRVIDLVKWSPAQA